MTTPSVFDDDTWRRMVAYAGPHLMQAKQVRITEFAAYSYESWPALEFGKLIAEAIKAIPAEYRDSATVELKGDDGAFGELIISYERPELPEDIAARIDRAYQYAREQQASERATYERLKQRYG